MYPLIWSSAKRGSSLFGLYIQINFGSKRVDVNILNKRNGMFLINGFEIKFLIQSFEWENMGEQANCYLTWQFVTHV